MSKRTQLKCHLMKAIMAELRKEPSKYRLLSHGVYENSFADVLVTSRGLFGPNSSSFRNGS
jgi:hypothetical protein